MTNSSEGRTHYYSSLCVCANNELHAKETVPSADMRRVDLMLTLRMLIADLQQSIARSEIYIRSRGT